MLAPRRVRRNLESQYCEPCTGGYYGRKKREAERDVLPGGPGGCMKFPACVLAQKKRRKRHAERTEQYHKQLEAHKRALKDHEEQHIRQKRQFFAPDANAACVPCPAWVTLALASRKKRSTNSSEDSELDEIPRMSLAEAIADIRKRAGYKAGFDDNDQSPRRKQGKCDQTDDCLNEVEYAIFKKVYHNNHRVKREVCSEFPFYFLFFHCFLYFIIITHTQTFRRRKCERCGSGFDGKRVKRNFGSPTINASEVRHYGYLLNH
ncbi:unnamed protein product [Nippostrongylus brasiliensis]|uniref:Thyroglobulin type-1 domain-containing protein n=1 Tax=Nippostrongylus brasiliensis TaxID=27835 RepID=A0A0N4YYV4_NIPBR|nr:unnamed protein product [Nippostrongylus brasiliensis]